MSTTVINYDPPTQLVPNVRTVYKIPRGIAVIPSTIKVLDILINPKDGSGNAVNCYFPALAGVWSAVSQIELLVGEKPVDLFLSKQASAFLNSLGNPDVQTNITSQLTGSSNNIYEKINDSNQLLQSIAVDSTAQALDLRKVLDYLNNRYIIEEGLSISITWDKDKLSDWLLRPTIAGTSTATVAASVNIQSGYLSYETVMNHKFPEQKVVNFKQTIEEAIILDAPGKDATHANGQDNFLQQVEQRMNRLRDKFITRCLFVAEPRLTGGVGQDPVYTAVKNVYGKFCSVGQLSEYLNIVIDGNQKLTFKGFAQPAHKLALTTDSWGVGSSSLTSWYLPKNDTLVDSSNNELSNYYSYLGVELETFVNKECVIQYQRKSGQVGQNASVCSPLKLYMISQVLKQHDIASGRTTYIRM